MGYDISITKTEVREVTDTLFQTGYTWNVARMFSKALGRNIHELNGKHAGGCVSVLTYAVADMKANKAQYEKLNPKNGFGNYDEALQVLENLLDACRKEPDGILNIY